MTQILPNSLDQTTKENPPVKKTHEDADVICSLQQKHELRGNSLSKCSSIICWNPHFRAKIPHFSLLTSYKSNHFCFKLVFSLQHPDVCCRGRDVLKHLCDFSSMLKVPHVHLDSGSFCVLLLKDQEQIVKVHNPRNKQNQLQDQRLHQCFIVLRYEW